MTVAVSVVSGVVAITSAVTSLAPHAVALSVGFVVLLAVVNLRGVKESGTAFALPTYAFVVLTFLLLASGAVPRADRRRSRRRRARTCTHPDRPGRRRPHRSCCACGPSHRAAPR